MSQVGPAPAHDLKPEVAQRGLAILLAAEGGQPLTIGVLHQPVGLTDYPLLAPQEVDSTHWVASIVANEHLKLRQWKSPLDEVGVRSRFEGRLARAVEVDGRSDGVLDASEFTGAIKGGRDVVGCEQVTTQSGIAHT
jgi:hypothetical protein